MNPARLFKDGFILSFGLLIVLGIGAWSMFSSMKKNDDSMAVNLPRTDDGVGRFQKMSADDLQDRIFEKNSESKPFALADIREETSWETEHIIGSRSFPLDLIVSFSPDEKEKSLLWILVSPDTPSANQAVSLLSGKGIPEQNIFVLEGGFNSWKEKVGLTTGKADPTSPVDATKVRLSTPEEAIGLLKKGGQWFILDVRNSKDFLAGHISGATNIPFSDIEVRRRMIPSTTRILVYGSDDRESFSAGVLLFDLGFFNTVTISAGFQDWKARGFPIAEGR